MSCIIVRHGVFQEYERLYAAYGHLVPVIWDRRADLVSRTSGSRHNLLAVVDRDRA